MQHNVIARGPAKGGLRYHPAERYPRRSEGASRLDDLEDRDGEDLPYGGAKGGMRLRSEAFMSKSELERTTRRLRR